MTPIEKLKAEIDEMEKKRDELGIITARYLGSGEDGGTDAEVLQAEEDLDRLKLELVKKRTELKKLGGDPLEGFVGATNADE
jgi:hypothetical protein